MNLDQSQTDEDESIDTEKLNILLQNRDEIIKHKLIGELNDSVAGHDQHLKSNLKSLPILTPRQRLSMVFNSTSEIEDDEFYWTVFIAKRFPLYIAGFVGMGCSLMRSVVAYDEFVRSHSLTTWKTQEMAKRRASDQIVLKALTFGISTGIRSYILSTGCFSFPIILTAINGRTSFWEYSVGWGTACSLYCFNRGLRQMCAAGLIAAVPGLCYGSVTMFLARKFGLTFEELLAKKQTRLLLHNMEY